MTTKLSTLLLATALFASSPALAVDPNAGAAVPTSLPQPQVANGVTYITGGIGDEERTQIEQSKKDYDLHIINADKHGAFAGKTSITVRDKDGNALVTADAGPLFYVKLPTGHYKVEAQLGTQNFSREFNIKDNQPITIELAWSIPQQG